MASTPEAYQLSEKQGTGDGAFDTEKEEVTILREMLEAMPEEDAKLRPGCMHGLCL